MISLIFMLIVNKSDLLSIIKLADRNLTTDQKDVLSDLDDWDGSYQQNAYEPTVFSVWEMLLLKR